MTSNKVILIIVGLFALTSLVVILAISAVFVGYSPSRTSTSASSTDKSTPIAVTAPVLVADYEANEIAADRKYKGQILEITGVVDSIGKDILDSMYVTLDSDERFGITNVQCFFDKSEETNLAALSKGRSLTVRGRCDGKFGNVLIKECAIVRVGN